MRRGGDEEGERRGEERRGEERRGGGGEERRRGRDGEGDQEGVAIRIALWTSFSETITPYVLMMMMMI